MKLVNDLRERRATYTKATLRHLSDLEDGTNATYDPEDVDDRIAIGPVAQVIAACPDYAVFVDGHHNIRYVVTNAGEAKIPPDFNLEWTRISKLQFMVDQLRESVPDPQLDSVRELIGQAVACGLDGHIESMRRGLDDIEPLLLAKTKRNAKRVYVSTAIGVATLTMLLALVGLGLNYSLTTKELIPAEATGWIAVVLHGILGGSVGALFSILTARTKEVPFDPMSSADYGRFEARARVLVGTLGGVLMGMCHVAGVISSSLTDVEPKSAGTLLLAVVAGFAERLVPNILMKTASQFDSDSDSESSQRPREPLAGAGARGGAAPAPQQELTETLVTSDGGDEGDEDEAGEGPAQASPASPELVESSGST